MNLNVRRFIPLFICTSVCLLVRALTVKISIPPFVFSKRQLAFLFLFEKYSQRDQLVPYLLMCSLALHCLYRSCLWLRSLVRSLAYLLTCSERLMDTFASSSPFRLTVAVTFIKDIPFIAKQPISSIPSWQKNTKILKKKNQKKKRYFF